MQRVKHDLFTAVISMCSKRILCRLRFTPKVRGKKSDAEKRKQSLRMMLQKAVNFMTKTSNKTLSGLASVIVMFVERAKEVMRMTDAWSKHQIQPRLADLVRAVHRLGQIESLDVILEAIPNDILDPSSRKSLFNIISKVARYLEAGRFMYQTAKKVPHARNMKVTIVTLPEEAWKRTSTNQYTPTLQNMVSRVSMPRQYNLDNVCGPLGLSRLTAEKNVTQQIQQTLTHAKVHAEIQILYFCELQRFVLPPRVICSSKDACFLCRAFIISHGKLHIPRSHGRLYPGWRLPTLPSFNGIEQRFNQVLEEHIKNSLRTLVWNQKKTKYPDPNESTLLTLDPSLSTLPSVAGSAAMLASEIYPRPSHKTSEMKAPSAGISGPNSSISTEAPFDGNVVGAKSDIADKAFGKPIRDASTTTISSLTSTGRDEAGLTEGGTVAGSLSGARHSRIVDVGHLRLEIYCPTDSQSSMFEATPHRVAYQLKWLSQRDAQELQQQKTVVFIDVDTLIGEVEHELDDSRCLYLRHGGNVVQLHLRQTCVAVNGGGN